MKISDLWQTPVAEIDFVRAVYGGRIDLDPCAGSAGTVEIKGKDGKRETVETQKTEHADTNYTHTTDGLTSLWFGNVFCNPPYSRPAPWAEACAQWADRSCSVMALLPATPATAWWQLHGSRAAAILLCGSRIAFDRPNGTKGGPARFDSAYLLWSADLEIITRFATLGRSRGMVVAPVLPGHDPIQQIIPWGGTWKNLADQ